MSLNFEGIYVIKATLKCITGLHIGGSKESFEIGGIDNPVIKTSISIQLPDREIKEGMPYIPGSSLKGKIRSLLEWKEGLVKPKRNSEGKIEGEVSDITSNGNLSNVSIIFGVRDSKIREATVAGPVRVKFADIYPTKETIEKWENELGPGIYTEVKTENAIDRITSSANPRRQERVPAGSEFKVEITYEKFDKQDEDRLRIVFEGMKLLEDNYLGGGGSRGNGRVKFENIEILYKDFYQGTAEKIGNFQSIDDVLSYFKKGV
ncbi:crispr-associated ramp protein, Csm3 family [Sulfurihydrogenibium azorense Az-Fu1]|uniref:CRISPR system Cms endoribonuclease Csm3 n=1 Tax=Sulfurihydrogenibium azorense (strain DSM 15241 / OCM 825 / Az-Fu1) TaxID=204536 RepID=C1DWT1_SULAA|nr:type III-A CRISPR-associated RAMP protein Csm3 [Sulfurihydrogenibium azorense]ACN98987.1 crispr-associated ramp protein, Csm3 family [Sulfurihydrogenibium azorense Az-Fu1]